MSQRSCSITFLPDGQEVQALPGRKLLSVILDAERPVGYSCRGLGICTACIVWVSGHVSPIGERERDLLAPIDDDSSRRPDFERRVACLTVVRGDVSVTTDYW